MPCYSIVYRPWPPYREFLLDSIRLQDIQPHSFIHDRWHMLRFLGLIFVVAICVEMAPWGLLAGALLLAGWLVLKPAPFSVARLRSYDEELKVTDAGSRFLSAIPLLNAVYCVNCDLITDSPHDFCAACGSHSVIAVSRLWQLTLPEVRATTARYKISFTADIRDIPANGLHESTKLITRLGELGGDVKDLHIQVEPVFRRDAIRKAVRADVLEPARRTAASACQHILRKVS